MSVFFFPGVFTRPHTPCGYQGGGGRGGEAGGGGGGG